MTSSRPFHNLHYLFLYGKLRDYSDNDHTRDESKNTTTRCDLNVNHRLDQNPKIVNDNKMHKIQLHLASAKTSDKNMSGAELCLMPEFKLPQSKASGF